MKRYIGLLNIILLVSLLISGCGFWMDGTRVSVTPHLEQNLQSKEEPVAVSTYTDMRNNLQKMIGNGETNGVITVSELNDETARYYMDTAIKYLKKNDPVCAYAVDRISYDIAINRGETVVAFQIEYYHGRAEILRIKQTGSMNEATAVISGALNNCEASIVLRIRQYEPTDFVQMVQDYANDNPGIIMEIPEVRVGIYPEDGNERIVELQFTYQTSREVLRNMRERVEPVFTSAELYVKGATQVSDIYSQLYSFLMERYDYKIETSITPTYSLLLHGVGDSRAFANIYAAMCRNAELDCKVISGTKNGEPWVWNLVRLRGGYYHVDLLQCSQDGQFRMLTDSEMAGYVWDYTAYKTN